MFAASIEYSQALLLQITFTKYLLAYVIVLIINMYLEYLLL
jgi:hypothetical protein